MNPLREIFEERSINVSAFAKNVGEACSNHAHPPVKYQDTGLPSVVFPFARLQRGEFMGNFAAEL